MFEFTNNDNELFDNLQYQGSIHPDAKYDFTFEHRYLVYHYPAVHMQIYVAHDKTTGYGSEICRRKNPIKKTEYHGILKMILFSIKYTGDSRYLSEFKTTPLKVIESIFRVILPEYGYNVREEQIKLAKNMYIGLTEKEAAICEAEVGTGKTMAYLVAGFVARQNAVYGDKPVTITTSSIELQRAVIEREIPNLSKMLLDYGLLEKPLTAVLRKGKEHYFCKARFYDFRNEASKYPEKYGELLEQFEKLRFDSRAFDMDDIRMSSFLKAKFSVQGKCSKCKYKDECKYAIYMDNAKDAFGFDFQVTNHNLYLTDRKVSDERHTVLLPSDYVIIDEAHKLREVAQQIFGEKLSEKDIPKYLTSVKLLCGDNTEKDEYRKLLFDAGKLNHDIFSMIRQKAKQTDTDDSIRIINLEDSESIAIGHLLAIIKEIEHCRRKTPAHSMNKALPIIKALKSLSHLGITNTWIEIDDNGAHSLCSCAKDIGAVLYKKAWNTNRSHIFTSGTLSDGVDFEYFKKEIGLRYIAPSFLLESRTLSPFDYQNHTRLYIADNIPSPCLGNTDEYITAVSDNIVNMVHATNGHTAILFTSYRTLHAVYEKVKDRLTEYELFYMARSNKTAISDFKKSKNGVLFASGSMWEGVDVRGDGLSSMIIVRLPFPMASSFSEMKKDDCENLKEFIDSYARPEMRIKLRQGAGRLIRSENDTGAVFLLDSRSRTSYKKDVEEVLGKYPRVDSIEEIEAFLKAVKPEGYYDA